MERATRGYRVFSFFNGMIMLMVIFATAYPMYYVLIASFSNPAALSRATGALWLPIRPFTLGAYRLVFDNPMIGRGFLNTAFILAAGVSVNVALTAMGAYFLSLKGPMFKTAITLMIVFTMYFSGGLIPSYLNLRDLKLLDSLWALILPSAVNTTNLIIMKTAFQAIPDSLVQSARLDGASHLRILASITLPLSMATVAVVILYYGVAHWNAWFGASIYLRNRDLFPLQLVMRNILNSLSLNEMMGGASMDEMARIAELIKYALIVVATAPILLLYPFLQRYFVKGVMVGAIKG